MNRLNLRSPLARWGFAILALTNGQYAPGLLCTGIAIYAWKLR